MEAQAVDSMAGGGFRGGGAGVFHGGRGGFHGGIPMRPGFGVHPGFGHGFRPGFNPGFRPGFNPGFRPAFRHGFNTGFRFFHGPSVVISPFFGFPFFPTEVYSQPIYTAPAYVAPDVTTSSSSDQTTNDLRLQVQQLTNEVQQLQAELSASGQPEPTSAATQKAVPVILVLRDGRQIEAQGYALVGSTLWILDPQNAMKISISDVDVDATRNENLKRGINVVIPASP